MPDPNALRRIVEGRLPRYLAKLESLVNVDCGSYTPEGVNRVADLVAASLGELGASVVSNDRYRDRIARYPEVEERIIRYMIVANEVVLERRGRRRD